MQAAKVQASLRIRAVSPEPPLLAHTSSESRGTFRQKARSLALLNCWACAVKVCHDGMLEDTNSLDAPQMISSNGILGRMVKIKEKIKTPETATVIIQTIEQCGYRITGLEIIKTVIKCVKC